MNFADNLLEIKNFLKKKRYKNILIITGKNSFYKSGANSLLRSILREIKFKIYFKRGLIPEIKELKKIVSLVNSLNPDLILAIGGGTVIDYSKIACCTELKEISFKKILLGKVKYKKKFQLCVIPTTAGSGAEVTSNSVIFINNKKFSFESQNLLPDNFFLIPSLILKSNKREGNLILKY